MSNQPTVPAGSPRATTAEPACCDPLAVRALTTDQASTIAPMFKALGDPIRLRLMSMIASQPEACVCDLTGAFEVSGPTISHHLRVLREAGLVDCQRRGTWVYYWVRPEAVRQLGELLALPARAPA
jgi:ArsR family transcriptional regulator, arsenate/arsenite/antimonite-responsive transcriptional repressor